MENGGNWGKWKNRKVKIGIYKRRVVTSKLTKQRPTVTSTVGANLIIVGWGA